MSKFHLGEMQLTSPSLTHGDRIPDQHTCNGADVSPALSWTSVPDGTVEFALVCHDPDAPLTDGFTHWVLYGIPGDVTSIPEGGGADYMQGTTDFGAQQYNGPAPPPGHGTHHYFFHLYALSAAVGADPGLTREELMAEIDELITVQARIVGTYDR